MHSPEVTIVISPRERFSYSEISLESIFDCTRMPYELVYVDGNSPKSVKHYLARRAEQKGFELIRVDRFLTPNQARNIGLARVKTPYVVFVDNDVVVSPGWLKALVQCAEEAKAAIVGPLTCQDEPVHQTVHFANGVARIITDVNGRRRLREKMSRQGQRVEEAAPKLTRSPAELVEFHCMLVDMRVFQQFGPLDERFLNTKEHVDLCLTVSDAGGAIYFEPEAIVTYVPGIAWTWADLYFYMLRWSDAWETESLAHLRQKWNLPEDAYFAQKRKALGWRRRRTILTPLLHRMTFGLVKQRYLKKILMYGLLAPVDRVLNAYMTTRFARRWLRQPVAEPVSDGSGMSELSLNVVRSQIDESSPAA